MKISHKLCVRMNGTQFFYHDGLQSKMSVRMIKEHKCNIQNLYAKNKKTLFLIQLPLLIVNRNMTQRLSQNMKKYITESESHYGLNFL